MTLRGERVTLRELVRNDLPAVLAVYNSNPGYNRLRNGTPAYILEELTAEYNEMLPHPGGKWLAICSDETLIGVSHVSVDHSGNGKSWIGLFLLHADWQRKGLGKEAVTLLENWLRSEGSTQIHTGVIAQNEPALRFWGALGYEQYRQVQGPVGRLTQPVLLLAKWLQYDKTRR
jgi:RimJ/RimL family protein N-acetyltransferase